MQTRFAWYIIYSVIPWFYWRWIRYTWTLLERFDFWNPNINILIIFKASTLVLDGGEKHVPVVQDRALDYFFSETKGAYPTGMGTFIVVAVISRAWQRGTSRLLYFKSTVGWLRFYVKALACLNMNGTSRLEVWEFLILLLSFVSLFDMSNFWRKICITYLRWRLVCLIFVHKMGVRFVKGSWQKEHSYLSLC